MSPLSRFLVIAGLKNDPEEVPQEERVLEKMREKLNVYSVEKTRAIAIEFSSEHLELAAGIANAIAAAYIAYQGKAKTDSNSAATAFLAPEITELQTQVRDAEAKVANYRAESGPLYGRQQCGAGDATIVRTVDRTVARARQPRFGGSDRRQRAKGIAEWRLAGCRTGGAVFRSDPAPARAAGRTEDQHCRSFDDTARQPSAHPGR